MSQDQGTDTSEGKVPPPSNRKRFVIPSFNEVDSVRSETVSASNIFKKRNTVPTINDTTIALPSTTGTSPYFSSPQQYAKASSLLAPNISTSNLPVTSFELTSTRITDTHTPKTPTSNGKPSTFGEAFAFVKLDPLYSPPIPSNPPPLESDITLIPNTAPQQHIHTPVKGAGFSSRNIIVNNCQKGNRLLKYIRNVAWEYDNIVPDYLIGANVCALFLSLKFHLLHPDNLIKRAKGLGNQFTCKVLLCLVDVDDNIVLLREICRICLSCDLTLILAWSNEEAARYLETYKVYEHKPADNIKQRVSDDYLTQLTDCLTQITAVNRTDVLTLASTFGSMRAIASASIEELSLCPGVGEKKVKHIFDAFRQPFKLAKVPSISVTKAQTLPIDVDNT